MSSFFRYVDFICTCIVFIIATILSFIGFILFEVFMALITAAQSTYEFAAEMLHNWNEERKRKYGKKDL